MIGGSIMWVRICQRPASGILLLEVRSITLRINVRRSKKPGKGHTRAADGLTGGFQDPFGQFWAVATPLGEVRTRLEKARSKGD